MIKPRFKVGQTVYMGRDDKMKTLVIESIRDIESINLYQYFFENTNMGVGEHMLRDSVDGEDLTLIGCVNKTTEELDNQTRTTVNTFGYTSGFTNDMNNELYTSVFFKPNLEFCEWLVEYAGDRMIFEIGVGTGHLLKMIKMCNPARPPMGIEPNFDYIKSVKSKMVEDQSHNVNEVLPYNVTRAKFLLSAFKPDQTLIVCARPCHGSHIVEALDYMQDGVEFLYITLPENIEEYDDLGDYESIAREIEFEGNSEDNEVVYSIIK